MTNSYLFRQGAPYRTTVKTAMWKNPVGQLSRHGLMMRSSGRCMAPSRLNRGTAQITGSGYRIRVREPPVHTWSHTWGCSTEQDWGMLPERSPLSLDSEPLQVILFLRDSSWQTGQLGSCPSSSQSHSAGPRPQLCLRTCFRYTAYGLFGYWRPERSSNFQ